MISLFVIWYVFEIIGVFFTIISFLILSFNIHLKISNTSVLLMFIIDFWRFLNSSIYLWIFFFRFHNFIIMVWRKSIVWKFYNNISCILFQEIWTIFFANNCFHVLYRVRPLSIQYEYTNFLQYNRLYWNVIDIYSYIK